MTNDKLQMVTSERGESSPGLFAKPVILLRIEGGLELALSLVFYQAIDANWILFVVLLLAPDLAMLGYLRSVRLGTICYNLVHTFAGPFLLIGGAYLGGAIWLLPYALIWSAHIALDRMLGFGLKYPTEFRDTHLRDPIANSRVLKEARSAGKTIA